MDEHRNQPAVDNLLDCLISLLKGGGNAKGCSGVLCNYSTLGQLQQVWRRHFSKLASYWLPSLVTCLEVTAKKWRVFAMPSNPWHHRRGSFSNSAKCQRAPHLPSTCLCQKASAKSSVYSNTAAACQPPLPWCSLPFLTPPTNATLIRRWADLGKPKKISTYSLGLTDHQYERQTYCLTDI